MDGQDFADIEACDAQRWLGELPLALRQETYRPDPIERGFILKANGKLRPLGVSTLRDRVCILSSIAQSLRTLLGRFFGTACLSR